MSFFETVCRSYGLECNSANGKSNIFHYLKTNQRRVLVIADGAAFGSEIDRIWQLLMERDAVLYLPESFEWLILSSGIFKDKELADILNEPAAYIESGEYFSWERFFSAILTERTKDTYLAYSKKNLNQTYLDESVKTAILTRMDKIILDWKASKD